tara:strand:+ start:248 stop:481 length:234 start_codon:yes stop_codon:yes gene_type:complete
MIKINEVLSRFNKQSAYKIVAILSVAIVANCCGFVALIWIIASSATPRCCCKDIKGRFLPLLIVLGKKMPLFAQENH